MCKNHLTTRGSSPLPPCPSFLGWIRVNDKPSVRFANH